MQKMKNLSARNCYKGNMNKNKKKTRLNINQSKHKSVITNKLLTPPLPPLYIDFNKLPPLGINNVFNPPHYYDLIPQLKFNCWIWYSWGKSSKMHYNHFTFSTCIQLYFLSSLSSWRRPIKIWRFNASLMCLIASFPSIDWKKRFRSKNESSFRQTKQMGFFNINIILIIS